MTRDDIIKKAKSLGLEVSEAVYWADDPIQPGDLYFAERNTGPKILMCDHVSPNGWIQATGFPAAYSYDTWECVKIVGEVPESAKKYMII